MIRPRRQSCDSNCRCRLKQLVCLWQLSQRSCTCIFQAHIKELQAERERGSDVSGHLQATSLRKRIVHKGTFEPFMCLGQKPRGCAMRQESCDDAVWSCVYRQPCSSSGTKLIFVVHIKLTILLQSSISNFR